MTAPAREGDRCRLCKKPGHNSPRCPKRPDRIESVEVPERVAFIAFERVRPIVKHCIYEENFLRAVTLSVYLQGLLDGQSVEVQRAVKEMQVKEFSP